MNTRSAICAFGLALFCTFFTPSFAETENTDHTMVQVDEANREAAAKKPLNLFRSSLGTTFNNGFKPGQNPPEKPPADMTDDLPVEEGQSAMVVEFKTFHNINKFSFRSFSAAGKVSISGTESRRDAEQGNWLNLGDPAVYSPGGTVDIEFPYTPVRFIKISFDTVFPGNISQIAILGEDLAEQATIPSFDDDAIVDESEAETEPFDFASSVAGARITHVSSGDPAKAQDMIDDDISTYFEFSNSGEEHVSLIDLSARKNISRVSMVMEADPGVLEIYTLHSLPEMVEFEGTTGSGVGSLISLPSSFFDQRTPAMVQEFRDSAERFTTEFPASRTRWLLMRWIPDAGAISSLNSDGSSSPLGRLKVFEVSLIGMVPEQSAFAFFVPRTQFLSLNAGTAAISSAAPRGPPIQPANPPPTLPNIGVISP